MNTADAANLSDAIARTRHPRSDYRTPEAQSYTQRLRPFLQQAIFPGCRVLDLGCASGKFTFTLEEYGACALGLDCSTQAIAYAREIAIELGSRAEFIVAEFEAIPFRPESFDLVLFPQNIIECSYAEMEQLTRQVRAILRPGGKFCLEMQDGLERIARDGWQANSFELLSGTRPASVSIPEQGEFPYASYFWTVAFANYVISKYFRLLRMEKEDDKRYWIEFVKQAS